MAGADGGREGCVNADGAETNAEAGTSERRGASTGTGTIVRTPTKRLGGVGGEDEGSSICEVDVLGLCRRVGAGRASRELSEG